MPIGTGKHNLTHMAIDTVAENVAELEPWQFPTMLNGHIAVTAANQASYGESPLSYYKDANNIVYFRGGVDIRSATGAIAFNLPAAYRPDIACTYVVMHAVSVPTTILPLNAHVTIGTNGDVTMPAFGAPPGGQSYAGSIGFNGFSFRVGAAGARPPISQTLGATPANQGLLTLGAFGEYLSGISLNFSANWTGNVTGYGDDFGHVQMMGSATTSVAQAANATIGTLSGASPLISQGFACAASGTTGGQPFVELGVGRFNGASFSTNHALNAGATVHFPTVVFDTGGFQGPGTTILGDYAANGILSEYLFQPTAWQSNVTGYGAVQSPYGTPGWRHDGRGRIHFRGAGTYPYGGDPALMSYPTGLSPATGMDLYPVSTNHYIQTPIRLPRTTVGPNRFSGYWGTGTGGGYLCLDGVSWRLF
jgi:hypothetical protein